MKYSTLSTRLYFIIGFMHLGASNAVGSCSDFGNNAVKIPANSCLDLGGKKIWFPEDVYCLRPAIQSAEVTREYIGPDYSTTKPRASNDIELKSLQYNVATGELAKRLRIRLSKSQAEAPQNYTIFHSDDHFLCLEDKSHESPEKTDREITCFYFNKKRYAQIYFSVPSQNFSDKEISDFCLKLIRPKACDATVSPFSY